MWDDEDELSPAQLRREQQLTRRVLLVVLALLGLILIGLLLGLAI